MENIFNMQIRTIFKFILFNHRIKMHCISCYFSHKTLKFLLKLTQSSAFKKYSEPLDFLLKFS